MKGSGFSAIFLHVGPWKLSSAHVPSYGEQQPRERDEKGGSTTSERAWARAQTQGARRQTPGCGKA